MKFFKVLFVGCFLLTNCLQPVDFCFEVSSFSHFFLPFLHEPLR